MLKRSGKFVTSQEKKGFESWAFISCQVLSRGCMEWVTAPRLPPEPDTPSFYRGTPALASHSRRAASGSGSRRSQAGGELAPAACAAGPGCGAASLQPPEPGHHQALRPRPVPSPKDEPEAKQVSGQSQDLSTQMPFFGSMPQLHSLSFQQKTLDNTSRHP